MSSRNLIGAVVGLLLIASATEAGAIDLSSDAFAFGSSVTSTPIGHYEFCRASGDECRENEEVVEAVILTQSKWDQLLSINAGINMAVSPVTDQELYGRAEFWTYPQGAGDCEDYVLAKRRALLDAGWFSSTLLIAVVRQKTGEGHAVLLVRTDRGDLVLDNQDGDIHVWNETPYTYLKRQSQADAGQWVDIEDRRIIVASAH